LIEDNSRPLKDAERRIFDRLFEKSFPGRDELVKQLAGLLVREIDQEGSLSLKVCSPVLARVRHRIPVEARYTDTDTDPEAGPFVHVLLHIVEGRTVELEIYKDDGSPIGRKPLAADLEVLPNDP
jgi:hypothetical protein